MCQPRKQADCTSAAFETELLPGLRQATVASATLDLRGASPASTWCISVTAPFVVASVQLDVEPVYAYLATYTLTLYRCAPIADDAYPVARRVAHDQIRTTFYPGDRLSLTPQTVATVPPDVYTAVLTFADPVTSNSGSELPSDTTVTGRINISATGQVLRYW